MLSQKPAVRDVDLYGRAADKFLSLIPRCCRHRAPSPPRPEHASWARGGPSRESGRREDTTGMAWILGEPNRKGWGESGGHEWYSIFAEIMRGLVRWILNSTKEIASEHSCSSLIQSFSCFHCFFGAGGGEMGWWMRKSFIWRMESPFCGLIVFSLSFAKCLIPPRGPLFL